MDEQGMGVRLLEGQNILHLHCFQARKVSYLMGKVVSFTLVTNIDVWEKPATTIFSFEYVILLD